MSCGTHTTEADIKLLLQNKEFSKSLNLRSMETVWIPVQFHLIAKSDGNGRIQINRVFEALCKLNEDFSSSSMQFYFNGDIKEINNSAMYDMNFPPIPSGVNTQFAIRRVQGNVNIFVGNGLASGNSGFYTSGTDVIYMDRTYMTTDDVILAHELGHYFGLPHTFFGWEDTTYDPDEPTPTEVFRGNTAYQVEYVDRTINCENSGDFFCGTPADYITDWNGGCDYAGGAVDPDSVIIDPDERNMMAYYSFANCDEYIFADDQGAAMMANYMNRGELNGTNIEKIPAVENQAQLSLPVNGGEAQADNVLIKWDAPEHATHYIVQVSRTATFIVPDFNTLTTETEVLLPELKIGRKYYWKVTAFNGMNTCDLIQSEVSDFTAVEMVSSTSETGFGNALSIVQNPISKGSPILIESDANLGESNVLLYDNQGRLIVKSKLQINEGRHQILDSDALAGGTYFLRVESKLASDVLKFVIL